MAEKIVETIQFAKPENTPGNEVLKTTNHAEMFIEQNIRPLLGDEIADFWKSESGSWTQRFVAKTWGAMAESVGHIPMQRPDPKNTSKTLEQQASDILKFKMEHWMQGGNIYTGGNLTITMATDSLRRNKSQKNRNKQLSLIGGAQARINWEKRHSRVLNSISKLPSETQEEALKEENNRYKSSLQKLDFLQKSKERYVKRRQKLFDEDQNKFAAHIERKNRRSIAHFNEYSHQTNLIVARDDKGNMGFRFMTGPWSQMELREELLIKPIEEPKGISVSFYRYNDDTGEKEFFVCYGKREAFARTHQLTPAYQTSFTRAKEGNHPDQPYNPMLASLKDAFSQAQSSNGVEISYIDLNPNRNGESPIAVATIDWASYSPEDQRLIMETIKKENGNKVLHSWIPESKIAILRRNGMVDKDGLVGPAVNGFLAISLGSRSPKEILEDGASRLAARQLAIIIEQNPHATLDSMQITINKLIEEKGETPDLLALRAMLVVTATQLTTLRTISEVFPHRPHQLSDENNSD